AEPSTRAAPPSPKLAPAPVASERSGGFGSIRLVSSEDETATVGSPAPPCTRSPENAPALADTPAEALAPKLAPIVTPALALAPIPPLIPIPALAPIPNPAPTPTPAPNPTLPVVNATGSPRLMDPLTDSVAPA